MKKRSRPVFVTIALLKIAFLTAACTPFESGTPQADGAWSGDVTTEGDTTTTVNRSGSVWGGMAELVGEASIGSDDSSEEYLFGRIRDLTSDGERIYVADSQVAVVRVYDLEGEHVMDIGGRGEGPGEFIEPKGVGITADGRILVQDDMGRRISVFAANGTFVESWDRQWAGSVYDGRFTVGPDGHAWIYEALGSDPDRDDREYGMRRYGPEGRTEEAVPRPEFEGAETPHVTLEIDGRTMAVAPVPFATQAHWTMGPDRTLVAGSADEYRFEIRHPDGTRTVVERLIDPVPVDPEEWEARKSSITASFRERSPGWTWNGPEAPPESKPFFERLYLARDGRVWVARQRESERRPDCEDEPDGLPCWLPRYQFDVFGADGRFLGSAHLDEYLRTDIWPWIRGETVILAVLDEVGNVLVKRYRLVVPVGESEPTTPGQRSTR